MTSYFSSFKSSSAISNFSTRFNSLRRAISSGDETDDPDSEDCSHISNVLRAYYTEKGRRLPPWLPADPKSPAPPTPTVAVATQASFQGYGGAAPPGGPAAGGRGAGGGLGDLWGDPSPARPPPQHQTSSLRLGRNPSHQPAPSSSTHLMPSPSNAPTRPATSASSSRTAGSYFDRQQSRTPPPPTATSARPLPSQRAGSYQTSQAAAAQQQGRLGTGIERSTSGVSAQERLRARLHGGAVSSSPTRTPSPEYGRNEPSGGGGQPYTGSSRPWESGDRHGSSTYGSGGGGGGGGGIGNGLQGRRLGQHRGPR
ncbi:uncharacterized protein BDCG_06724 [Blastomyces dermatitidis ER-3]|uniref:Mso1 N-terminal domain-containing protein n=1 Tax=Ajellomyces dermatitidis (strain ER-3 / ATCC MYA-2586) TaxID=559297 RepID=A0ABP2F3V4_AJEDR|nr:uncharacterized protein BDCG_06724 [Blastomyces dermatitidis ER-3]EEQ91604.1 hypothetical protein BDCG_06724 [Blastomyces dermatitidis ER-3]